MGWLAIPIEFIGCYHLKDFIALDPNRVKQNLLAKKMELLLREDDSIRAYNPFSWILEVDAILTNHQKVTAYYRRGLDCEAQGVNKSAAFAFRQAYILHPGWEVLDQELDMLEAMSGLGEVGRPKVGYFIDFGTSKAY